MCSLTWTYPFTRVLRFLSGASQSIRGFLWYFGGLSFPRLYAGSRGWAFWTASCTGIRGSLRIPRLERSVLCFDGHEEGTLGDSLCSYRAVHTRPSREGTIPAVREKTTSAVQSVSQENNFVKSVVAFAAVEGILSSAVPSASFTGRRIVVSFRNSLSPKFPLRAANVLPWVHWLRVVPWIAVFAALSRTFLASGFAWISVSDGYLAQFLHAELSSNCMMEPGFTGRRRSSSLTVLTTLLNREHHCGCRQLFENHTDPFQQGWASARLLSGTTSCSSSFPAVACGRWSLLLVSREARGGQFYDDFFV